MTLENWGIAENAEDREAVYRLRHDCYLRKGSIDSRDSGLFSDFYDETPNNFSFLMRSADTEPLATVRISVVRPDLNWTESPVRKVFGDHPAFQTLARESFVEASRLCFARQSRRDVLMQLLGNMAALAEFYDVKWLIACPRVEHAPIYQRLFGFRPLAEPRPYFGVKFETQLLGVRLSELREYVRGAKPMCNAWQSALARLQGSQTDIATLRVEPEGRSATVHRAAKQLLVSTSAVGRQGEICFHGGVPATRQVYIESAVPL